MGADGATRARKPIGPIGGGSGGDPLPDDGADRCPSGEHYDPTFGACVPDVDPGDPPEDEPGQPNLTVEGCPAPTPASATSTDEVTVQATISNIGDADTEGLARFFVAGEQFAQATATVPAGESRTVDASFVPADLALSAGDHDVTARVSAISNDGGFIGLAPADPSGCSCGRSQRESRIERAFSRF